MILINIISLTRWRKPYLCSFNHISYCRAKYLILLYMFMYRNTNLLISSIIVIVNKQLSYSDKFLKYLYVHVSDHSDLTKSYLKYGIIVSTIVIIIIILFKFIFLIGINLNCMADFID